ncbi:MAG TPA: O-antigen ligase family protein, partial [Candidatus Ozemobacteraceae bacterium]|nr:O-antigen ligase family protein [Candidatus Ozemobacteraceae bacterium]
MTRLASGWKARRWAVILAGGFVLFYQQSLTGWIVRSTYSWMHLEYQVSFILIGLFVWTSPSWKRHLTILGWSAVPMVAAPLFIRLQAGEALFADRFAFATMHPNLLASGFFLGFMALSIGLERTSDDRVWRLAGMTVLACGILLTQSRLQIVMLILGALYSCNMLRPSRYRLLMLIMIGMCGIYFAGIGLHLVPDRFDYRNVPSERLFIWQAGMYRILNAPWGEGFLSFGHGLQPLTAAGHESVWDWFYPHTHSLYLETFLALGIPMGLAVMVFLLVILLRRSSSEGGTILLGSQMVMGFAEFVWYTPFHLVMLIAAMAGEEEQASAETSDTRESPAPVPFLLLAFVALSLVGIQQERVERAAVLQQRGWQEMSAGHAAQALDAMQAAGDLDPKRLEYPLYEALMSWQCGETENDRASAALRRLQRLLPDWDINWMAQAFQQVIQGND